MSPDQKILYEKARKHLLRADDDRSNEYVKSANEPNWNMKAHMDLANLYIKLIEAIKD